MSEIIHTIANYAGELATALITAAAAAVIRKIEKRKLRRRWEETQYFKR